jgi:hypothetical protein
MVLLPMKEIQIVACFSVFQLNTGKLTTMAIIKQHKYVCEVRNIPGILHISQEPFCDKAVLR